MALVPGSGTAPVHQDTSWISPSPLKVGISGHGICSHSKTGASKTSLGCHCCRISLWKAGRPIPESFGKGLSQIHPSFCSVFSLPPPEPSQNPRGCFGGREKRRSRFGISLLRVHGELFPPSRSFPIPLFPFLPCSFPSSPQPQFPFQPERDTLHAENTFEPSARLLGSRTNANTGPRCLSRGTEYKSARLVPAPGRPQLEYAV